MLRFLRKIRKSVIASNSFKRYVLYALGEIALVVLGILIALQINTWNSKKKEIAEEERILMNMMRDLQRDTVQLNDHIHNASENIQKLDTLYKYMVNPEGVSSHEFLNKSYAMAAGQIFEVNSVTFEESVSTGTLKYIQNDALRQEIFEYYRKATANRTDKFINDARLQMIWPVAFKKLSPTKEFMDDINKPNNLPSLDVEILSNDLEFVATLNNSFTNTMEKIRAWQTFLENAEQLIDSIKKDLNR